MSAKDKGLLFVAVVVAAFGATAAEDCVTLSPEMSDAYARCMAEELADAIERGEATSDTLASVSDQCFAAAAQELAKGVSWPKKE